MFAWWSARNLPERGIIVFLSLVFLGFLPGPGSLILSVLAVILLVEYINRPSPEFQRILRHLQAGGPSNDAGWGNLMRATLALKPPGPQRQLVYEAALACLKLGSSPGAKTYCLEIGRWYMGHLRKGKVPSVYDEQAIQNDILVRSK